MFPVTDFPVDAEHTLKATVGEEDRPRTGRAAQRAFLTMMRMEGCDFKSRRGAASALLAIEAVRPTFTGTQTALAHHGPERPAALLEKSVAMQT